MSSIYAPHHRIRQSKSVVPFCFAPLFFEMGRAALSIISIAFMYCLQSSPAVAQSNSTSSLGTNLAAVNYYSSEQPFLNIFKTGSGWDGGTTAGAHYNEIQGVFNLDANGYPQTMTGVGAAAGQIFSQIETLLLRNLGEASATGASTAPFYQSGNFVLLYSGTGTFNFNFDCINSNIVSSSPGRIVINIPAPSTNGCQIGITSMGAGSNYPSNIAFIYSPDSTGSNVGTNETLYEHGEVFTPTFINQISNFRTLRFMDWMQTNQTVQSNWSGRPMPTQAFWGIMSGPGNVDPMPQGVPIEVMVALCNKISADGWFNMPPLSTDDYVTHFAALVHNGGADSSGRSWAGLNPNSKAYVEYGNEIWNNGALATFNNLITLGEAAFPNYDSAWGAAFYYAILRAVQNGVTWRSVWGADANRVVRVLGGQNGYTGRNQFILQFTAGMYGGNATAFSGTAAQNVDAFAVAPYFGYAVPDTLTLDQLFTEILSGGFVSAANGGYPGGMIAQTLNWAQTNYSMASSYGIALVAYEGGQSLVDPTGSDTALGTLYLEANRDPRMGAAYTALLNGWKNLGGALFNNFNDIQPYSKWGYWGALENYQQTTSPKYAALMNFIAANPCWWSGCPVAGVRYPSSGGSSTPPSVPTGLTDALASASQVNTSWNQSTAGTNSVAGYNVFRNGTKVGTTANSSYQDTGLAASTTYTYAVSAYDTAGNTSAQSSPVSVTTPSPPTIAVSSPRNGTLVKGNGSVTITATASDINGIKSIAIMDDGNILLTCSGATSCSTTWQGKQISQGSHVIGVTATDAYGLQSTSSVSILALK